jgi:hypothetical protein
MEISENKKNIVGSSELDNSNLTNEGLTQDIEKSLDETIESTLIVFKNFANSINTSIKDEDIKRETIEIIDNALQEFRRIVEKNFENSQPLSKMNFKNLTEEE